LVTECKSRYGILLFGRLQLSWLLKIDIGLSPFNKSAYWQFFGYPRQHVFFEDGVRPEYCLTSSSMSAEQHVFFGLSCRHWPPVHAPVACWTFLRESAPAFIALMIVSLSTFLQKQMMVFSIISSLLKISKN